MAAVKYFESKCFLIFLFASYVVDGIVAAADVWKQQKMDRISSLPGQPPVSFSQFSGYVTVDEKHGRALFYWLIEATAVAEKKPLVLWLNGGQSLFCIICFWFYHVVRACMHDNGNLLNHNAMNFNTVTSLPGSSRTCPGPGCSSVAYGASEEIGPFRINKTGSSLCLNKYSWNTEANILFLESPAGVGFSYTNTSSDLKDSGDNRTGCSYISHQMDVKISDLQAPGIYIAGESYAGHYVPQLAKKIHDYNKAHSNSIINLRGFMVGNAVTDNYFDSIGTVTYWWSHSMISDKTYKTIMKDCNFTEEKSSARCDDAVSYAIKHEFGNIDQYSIYTPSCLALTNGSRQHIRLKNTLLLRRGSGYDPCTENYAERYYNRPDVQKVMHANTTGIPYKWTACSDVLIKNWKDSENSMLPIYKELISAGLRIWVFSGDTDSIVPVTATRFSLGHLNLHIKTPWYPWYSGNQVGGWTEVYEGLTFATVRGAGHEVPLFQPRRAFVLFRSFLKGEKLPKSI
ncbi:Serine carboxypeptidase 24 [Hibiscus syriacus]|uniref:Carboxypeptidase n=1 Tax=Hibiscus syriacus TaxID=106335 RepID=A0A6A2Z6P8_HIBSY|nr:Serine carboxypeptidase 24 [Hibiscus syriacus]